MKDRLREWWYSDEGRLPIARLTAYALKQNPSLLNKPIRTEKQRELNRKHSYTWFRNHRIANAISCSMRSSLKNGKASKHWEQLIDYNLSELKKHLQKQFIEGMSWDNYGEWEIDHVIPVSAFTFTSPKDIDFKRCWALSNLQPLWQKDNRTKHNKIIQPFQFSLQNTLSTPVSTTKNS